MSNKQDVWDAASLLAKWIFASLIGWAAGLVAGLGIALVATILPGLDEDRFLVYALLISLGLTLGAAQWVVLRRYLLHLHPVRWIVATLIGHLLCLIVIVASNTAHLGGISIWSNVPLLSLLGTAIGTCQWWILRQHYRQARVWVLASAAGFLCFLWIVINPTYSPVEFIARGTLVGALAAALPGVVLVRLVRQPLAAIS